VNPSTRLPGIPDRPHGERPLQRPERARLWAALVAIVFHAALFALIVAGPPVPRPPAPEPEPPPFVSVMFAPRLPPPPDRPDRSGGSPPRAKAEAPRPKPAPTPPALPPLRQRVPRQTPPPEIARVVAGPASIDPGVALGEADLAGATVAGTGDGAGGLGGGNGSSAERCDMVRRLQDALRDDPEVTAAVTRSHRALGPGGKAILIWNGEWLRNPGEAGRGLAGVRQAITMEVAFAPAACRARVMRGLVVISFNDRSDAPRLALGSREWRWAELLSARR